ncbi:MAG: Hsp70 family protein [Candidatus Riflebacteria bacterium]|nr:Hsp70 family protein [Candidatus Riflebacteria bacterium]
METEYAFGIDFGTTSTAVVGLRDGLPKQFGRDDGQPFPSLVAVNHETGQVVCGLEVWEKRQGYAERHEVIGSFKQHLGTSKTWQAGGRTWTPVDACSKLLEHVVQKVEEKSRGRGSLREAVFSIPIGFTSAKRRDLRLAAEKAGIEVLQFVSEPTAAAMELASRTKGLRKAAVFDWGGGTLDITVLAVENGVVLEQETAGMDVAGDHIDRKVSAVIHNQVTSKRGLKIALDEMPARDQDRMLTEAEKAKRRLSEVDDSDFAILAYGPVGPIHGKLFRSHFFPLIEPEVKDAYELLLTTIKKRNDPRELDHLFAIGGSSNLPQIRERLVCAFGNRYFRPTDAAWCVAEGAARLACNRGSHLLADDFGLIDPEGDFLTLLDAETPLSEAELCRNFGLVEDTSLANFVFAMRRRHDGCSSGPSQVPTPQVLDDLSVECFGFCNEFVELGLRFDADLVLHARARSKNKAPTTQKERLLEKLRFAYRLPCNQDAAT